MACLQTFFQYYAPAALTSWHKTLIYETFWFVLEICKTINDIFHLELLRETEINRQDGDISKHGTDEFAGTVFEKIKKPPPGQKKSFCFHTSRPKTIFSPELVDFFFLQCIFKALVRMYSTLVALGEDQSTFVNWILG